MVLSSASAWVLGMVMVASPKTPSAPEKPAAVRARAPSQDEEASSKSSAEDQPGPGSPPEPTATPTRFEPGTEPPGEAPAKEAPPVKPSDAPPDSAETAKQHFLRAQELLEDERYAEAAREFARSHEAVPTSVALYNMALAHERAGELVEALQRYAEYLAREDVVEPRRGEVTEAVARLREQVVEFSLATPENIELRQIRVNGEPVSVDDFPLMVLPGSIRIELVTARDGQVHVRDYEVQAGQRVTVDLALFAPTTPKPHRPSAGLSSSVTPAPSSRVPAYLFWTGLAATTASGLSVMVLGLAAQGQARRFSEALCPNPCTEEIRDEYPYPAGHRDRALALATATNVMIGVTVGLGVATLVAGAVALARRPQEPRSARLRLRSRGLVWSW